MKVLITGGSSLLGKYLVKTAPENITIESTWYTNPIDGHQMDVTNKSQIGYVFSKVKPDVIIHCAGNGNVDYAENNYREVYQVNVEGTENILKIAKDYKAKVIYISTNAVFNGKSPPYFEDSIRHPINVYGSVKRQAEDRIQDTSHWLIIRPFLFYGWPYHNGRQNWVTTTIDKLSRGESLKIVDDRLWQPTYVEDCAETIWKLLEYNKEIFHVSGEERISLYDFVNTVADIFELPKNIKPVSSDYFITIAKRPKDTTYDLSKIKSLDFKLSSIKEGLKKMKKEKDE